MDDSDRLADYRDYYRSRARRSAANPLYPETAAAEQAMADAVDAATSIEDLRATAVELSMEMGRALARDQASARAAVYAETDEDVRAQGPAEVLAGIESTVDAPALASMLAAIEQRTGIAVTVDELNRLWATSLTTLRTSRCGEPPRCRIAGGPSSSGTRPRRSPPSGARWAQVETEGRQHQAGWSFDPEVARAERHLASCRSPTGLRARLAEHGSLVRGGR